MSKQRKVSTVNQLMRDIGEVALESAGGEPAPAPTTVKEKSPTLSVVPKAPQRTSDSQVVREGELQALGLDQIVAEEQHRTQFDADGIKELAANIKHLGLIQPIIVRWNEAKHRFAVVAGERRFRAVQLLKLKTIPALIKQLTDAEVAEIQLSENLNREALNPIDQAKAFQSIITKHGRTATSLADNLGLDRTTVSRSLRLLTLPADIQKRIAEGKVGSHVAREVARIKDEKTQRAVLAKATKGRLTGVEVEQLVKTVVGDKKVSKKSAAKKKRKAKQLTFDGADRATVIVLPDADATYDDVAKALTLALEEVEHRLKNRTALF